MEECMQIKQEPLDIKNEYYQTEFDEGGMSASSTNATITEEDINERDAVAFEFVSGGTVSTSVNIKREQIKDEGAEDQPEYIEHGELADAGEVRRCDICRRQCASAAEVATHRHTHTDGTDAYTCLICYKTFATKALLHEQHISVCHSLTQHKGELQGQSVDRPHECDICHKRFMVKQNFKIHMRTHTGEKPYECEICQSRFTHNSSFTLHMYTHSGEKPYKCDICNIGFTQNITLKRHMRTHTGEKPHECHVCHTGFTQKATLIRHVRTHTKEKPYECNICHIGFAQKGKIARHMRTHTGDKPYACDICHIKFGRKDNLAVHKRTHVGNK